MGSKQMLTPEKGFQSVCRVVSFQLKEGDRGKRLTLRDQPSAFHGQLAQGRHFCA